MKVMNEIPLDRSLDRVLSYVSHNGREVEDTVKPQDALEELVVGEEEVS